MKNEDYEDYLRYFMEYLHEFMEYKKQSREKQNKINKYEKSNPHRYKVESLHILSEPEINYLNGRKRTLIPFEDIICYAEELPIEYAEDKKTIQIMLYELAGRVCAEEEYKRISDVSKERKSSRESPSVRAKALLAEFISKLKSEGKKGKSLLAPYASAYKLGFARKMSVEEFNYEYKTSIKPTTYNNWMSPVFNGVENYKYSFSPNDLNYYNKRFEELR